MDTKTITGESLQSEFVGGTATKFLSAIADTDHLTITTVEDIRFPQLTELFAAVKTQIIQGKKVTLEGDLSAVNSVLQADPALQIRSKSSITFIC